MSLIGALTQAAGKTAKKTAPFYSAVDEALANLKRPKGTGAEFFTELSKQAGVKKAELADRKLEQAFKAKGKMTKEEAQQVLKDNPPPKLREKVYDESTAIDEEDLREMVSQEMFGKPYDDIYKTSEVRRILDEVYKRMDKNLGTKYGEYKTPDGENYREILLKLPPNRPNASNYSDPAKYDADLRAYNRLGKGDYHSSHWEDEPNVLAHMRVQDRVGPNGEKILHVEEIQSDWHQAGRKKGYRNEEQIKKAQREFADYSKDARERMRQLMLKESETEMAPDRALRFVNQYVDGLDDSAVASFLNEKSTFNNLFRATKEAGETGVPDAPFKKNWHELAMKRLLNYAADNGYDSIAITPGVEQAKRYDLSKQISRVVYSPETETLNAFDHNDRSVVMRSGVKPDQVADYIGKEPAQRLFDEQNTKLDFKGGKDVPYQEISGIDLKVGGEGMIGFYDKMLPDYLNTYGKPYGAQVQQNSIPVSTREPNSTSWGGGQGEHPFITVQDLNEPFEGMVELMRRDPETGEESLVGRMLRADSERRMAQELRKLDTVNQIKLHNFPITPEMRESIKQKGLPLYQQIGIPTAGAGAASQIPQEEPEYGTGGAIAKMAKKAIPVVKAPEIIKPSGLTELKKIVEQEKGGYGSRRLERAADEIPNLEKLYSERALREAFTGDNARALMTMNPADFEKFAMPLVVKTDQYLSTPVLNSRIKARTADKLDMPTDEYVKYLMDIDRFDDVPFLTINKEEQGLPLMPFISGHEGRHRNRSLASRGEQAGLVQLLPRAELREPFPRRSQEQYIEALKQELEMTGNKVEPEKYRLDLGGYDSDFIRRPPIKLPDIYAKGGVVKHQVKKADGGAINFDTAPDMSDGGRIIQGAPFKRGGKVNMTTNRDTMFLELSNKKLKRK